MRSKHIAFMCTDSAEWAVKKKKKPCEGYRKTFEKILEIIDMQLKKNIPITTFNIMPLDSEDHTLVIDELGSFLTELDKNEKIHKNKIKISILGKWYSLPSRIIEPIKKIIEDTKDYDSFFVNLCINYDGQEELVDAAKMIARRVKLGKLEVDSITKDTIKDDLYSSYFMPPDKIFIFNKRNTKGFLLWDCVDSEIIFLKKDFPEIKIKDIEIHLKDKK